jgi:cobalt-precorrin 5A hydrolase / precorrin-3B C17-methyltransferase
MISTSSKKIIFILGPSALPLAKSLRGPLFAEIHGPAGVEGVNATYVKAKSHLADLFKQGHSIIGICAAGILIRSIAAHTDDKNTDPPVIAVSEDGRSVVPLLGGHHGANELAVKIASLSRGHAAITTASDVMLGVSLDEPPEGYVIADRRLVKPAMARLLAGEWLRSVDGSAPWLASVTHDDGTIPLAVTTKRAERGNVTFHPQSLVVGVGCERGTSPDEVQQLVNTALLENGLAREAIAHYATIDVKEDEPAISKLGEVRYFTAAQLQAEEHRVKSPSDVVKAEVGTSSVCEAAALAAAGPDAKLIVPKIKGQRSTVAIAEAPVPITKHIGRAAGAVHIIGLGPGSPDFRAPEASAKLKAATDWVGYSLYLDLADDLYTDQIRHNFPLGGEEDRCRKAIALASEGKRVALICSGDSAIYAMAALVYELLDREPARIAVDVVPGISAFQLASARAGALIGHDFCCISLSDLLTPWEAIHTRVAAAAIGDFVVAFYNPRSLKRTDHIIKAFATLKPHREPDTPVIIASNLGRPQEKFHVIRFEDFDPEQVDMLTIVLVGSSQSRMMTRGDGQTSAYTPRGYAKKMAPLPAPNSESKS